MENFREFLDTPLPVKLALTASSFWGKTYEGTFAVAKRKYGIKFAGAVIDTIPNSPMLWELSFGVDNKDKDDDEYAYSLSSERTNEGWVGTIFATVIETLRHFIQKIKPDSISYEGADEGLDRFYRILEAKFSQVFANYQKVKPGLFVRKDKMSWANEFAKYA